MSQTLKDLKKFTLTKMVHPVSKREFIATSKMMVETFIGLGFEPVVDPSNDDPSNDNPDADFNNEDEDGDEDSDI